MMDFSILSAGLAYERRLPRRANLGHGRNRWSAAAIADARRVARHQKAATALSWNMGITFNVMAMRPGWKKSGRSIFSRGSSRRGVAANRARLAAAHPGVESVRARHLQRPAKIAKTASCRGFWSPRQNAPAGMQRHDSGRPRRLVMSPAPIWSHPTGSFCPWRQSPLPIPAFRTCWKNASE